MSYAVACVADNLSPRGRSVGGEQLLDAREYLAERGMARAFQLVHIFPSLTVAETIAVAVVSLTPVLRLSWPDRRSAASRGD